MANFIFLNTHKMAILIAIYCMAMCIIPPNFRQISLMTGDGRVDGPIAGRKYPSVDGGRSNENNFFVLLCTTGCLQMAPNKHRIISNYHADSTATKCRWNLTSYYVYIISRQIKTRQNMGVSRSVSYTNAGLFHYDHDAQCAFKGSEFWCIRSFSVNVT